MLNWSICKTQYVGRPNVQEHIIGISSTPCSEVGLGAKFFLSEMVSVGPKHVNTPKLVKFIIVHLAEGQAGPCHKGPLFSLWNGTKGCNPTHTHSGARAIVKCLLQSKHASAGAAKPEQETNSHQATSGILADRELNSQESTEQAQIPGYQTLTTLIRKGT